MIYVSSSLRESSGVPQALAGLNTPKFRQLIRDTPGGHSAIGVWLDGAEETRVFPGNDLRLAAALGLKYKQKSVLLWRPGEGEHELHVYPGLAKGRQPEEVQRLLTAHGLPEAHTQMGNGDVHLVYSATAPQQPVDGVIPHVTRGHSEWPGGDTREQAAEVYRGLLS